MLPSFDDQVASTGLKTLEAFGRDIVLLLKQGDFTVKAIIDEYDPEEMHIGDGLVQDGFSRLTLLTSDLPNISRGDSVIVDGQTKSIKRNPTQQSDGFSVIYYA